MAQLADPVPVAGEAPAAASATDGTIDFAADILTYDNKQDLVTANGQVRLARDGNYLAADTVSWDRKTGKVQAAGNCRRGQGGPGRSRSRGPVCCHS